MGNAESQPVRNVDKRTARRDHAPKFISAISDYRYENGLLGECTGDGAGRGVAEAERKRRRPAA